MKITIYSTKGKQKYVHETSATTFGELKNELRNEFDFNSLTATENITRRDLTVDSALLPTEDFNLFLRPKQTKLGASNLSYREAKDLVKSSSDNTKEAIKIHFGANYTNLSTQDLNKAVELFINNPPVSLPEEDLEDSEEENIGSEVELDMEDLDIEDFTEEEIKKALVNLTVEICKKFGITSVYAEYEKKDFYVEVSDEDLYASERDPSTNDFETDELEKEAREIFG